jgi:hypothetical protein
MKPGTLRTSAFDPAPREARTLGDAVRYNEDLSREVGAVEERVEQLKVRYEQWFMGLERREPGREREELKREVQRLKGTFTRNTGLRFRIQSLNARFISYERMWQRSAREKEEGTYRRDVLRARRAAELAREAAQPAPPSPLPASAPALAQATAGPAPAPAATTAVWPPARLRASPLPAAPAPVAVAVPGISEAQLRALHAEYVDAKRRCNEDASRFTVDALARSLARQVPDLLTRFQARTIEFRVTVQGGRTVLKAVPRA